MRVLLKVAYDGTSYSGWQIQPNAVTVEGVLREQLKALFSQEIDIIGASRTDAGVHAMGNVAVFDIETRIPAEKIAENEIRIPIELPRTCTDILYHLLVKVAFNALSTGTMAKMGRVYGNWMVQVLPTNKKLIDRSSRIIWNLAKTVPGHEDMTYEQAVEEFFISYYNRKPEDEYRESYVIETLRRLGFDPNADIK